MNLPGLEYILGEHDNWQQQRRTQYARLTGMRHNQGTQLNERLTEQHLRLVQKAFLLTSSGVRVVKISDSENLMLCHTAASSIDRTAALLVRQTKHSAGHVGFDLRTKTIATFGERINIEKDIRSGGHNSIGVGTGVDMFLGVLASHQAPGMRKDYIPYDNELPIIEDLLAEFDAVRGTAS